MIKTNSFFYYRGKRSYFHILFTEVKELPYLPRYSVKCAKTSKNFSRHSVFTLLFLIIKNSYELTFFFKYRVNLMYIHILFTELKTKQYSLRYLLFSSVTFLTCLKCGVRIHFHSKHLCRYSVQGTVGEEIS